MWRTALLLPIVILAAPLPNQFEPTVDYLHRYGYLGSEHPSLHEVRTALRLFQDVSGVPPTGELDDATVRATRRPRCSHQDTHKNGGRRKRFAFATVQSQSKWDRKHYTGDHELLLKWHVSKYTKDINPKIIRSQINKAFTLWSSQSNLKVLPRMTFRFEEVQSKEEADINILWAEGDHGDAYKNPAEIRKYSFDGNANSKENILAHTFFPGHIQPLNGDIHFDDAEDWEVDPEKTKDNDRRFFPYVLAHEIGHALGLQHSRKPEAVMNPFYSNTPLDQLQLDVDDKCGINWNYVGPSNFCLFVWLMSEIVPLHNNTDDAVTASDHILPSNHRVVTAKRLLKRRRDRKTEEDESSEASENPESSNGAEPAAQLKTSLNLDVRIPRCIHNNDLQQYAERKLHRGLHFPHEEAKKYSGVVCNFLAGLHVYRGGPDYNPDEPIEQEYHGVNKQVSEFSSASANSIRRMARTAERRLDDNEHSVFDPSYFDDEFFDGFLPLYLQYHLEQKK